MNYEAIDQRTEKPTDQLTYQSNQATKQPSNHVCSHIRIFYRILGLLHGIYFTNKTSSVVDTEENFSKREVQVSIYLSITDSVTDIYVTDIHKTP